MRKKPGNMACECRLNRNLNGVTATLDDSSLCTRVTIDQNEGAPIIIDAETIGTWGVVNRTITIEEGKDAEGEARKYIKAHQNPALSVELDALALAELTGEPWDSFALGQVCRVALPEFQTTLNERIVCLNYNDLYGDPRHVQITLSSEISDTSSSLAGLQSMSQRNGGMLYKFYHEVGEEAQILAERITLMGEQINLSGDEGGDRFEVGVFCGQEPIDLTGARVYAYFIRSGDGATDALEAAADAHAAAALIEGMEVSAQEAPEAGVETNRAGGALHLKLLIPRGPAGQEGQPGKDGQPGADGQPGEKGDPGKDGSGGGGEIHVTCVSGVADNLQALASITAHCDFDRTFAKPPQVICWATPNCGDVAGYVDPIPTEVTESGCTVMVKSASNSGGSLHFVCVIFSNESEA